MKKRILATILIMCSTFVLLSGCGKENGKSCKVTVTSQEYNITIAGPQQSGKETTKTINAKEGDTIFKDKDCDITVKLNKVLEYNAELKFSRELYNGAIGQNEDTVLVEFDKPAEFCASDNSGMIDAGNEVVFTVTVTNEP